jgi:hypothetical protein
MVRVSASRRWAEALLDALAVFLRRLVAAAAPRYDPRRFGGIS